MNFEVKDLTGLGQPLTKLLEVIQVGCGAMLQPWQIRRIAGAKADEIKILESAKTDSKIASAHALASVAARELAFIEGVSPEIVERAKLRLGYTEVQRQLNIESVIATAAKEMPEKVTEEKPDPNWITRFFSMAGDVTEQNMQELWGKVLAGETAAPGRFSLRTMEVLRNLSQAEAEAFGRACFLVFGINEYIIEIPKADSVGPFFVEDAATLGECGLPYSDRLILVEAGLIVEGLVLQSDFAKTFRIPNNGRWIEISKLEQDVEAVETPIGKIISPPRISTKLKEISVIKFTSVGKALGGLVPNNFQQKYIDLLTERYAPLGFNVRLEATEAGS